MWRAALVVLLAAAVACSSDDPEPAASSGAGDDTTTTTSLEWTGDDDGFYAPPDPLPAGEPGDLLRHQVVESDVDGTTYRVLHLSESVQGDPIAVSGVVVVPEGATGTVLTWAHGTTGIADVCAPSKDPGGAVDLAPAFLERGWVFAATDYEGLGTPGRHPYIVGTSEGRGVLDVVRAAAQLPSAPATGDVVVWGHSQGGHAALWAGQLAADWAPELDVVGVVAGAPASELPLITQALQNGPFQHYLALGAAGINAAYPEADLSLVMTDEAQALLSAVDEGCAGEIADDFALPYEEFAVADPASVEPWGSLLLENDPGHVKTEIPVLVIHGEEDEQIPVVASSLLLDRVCGLGQVIERRTYPGMGHAEVIGPSFDDMVTWMEARVAGETAESSCP